MDIVYALLIIVGGVLAEIYPFQIVRIFGHLDWAEKYLGSGGSYTAWRLGGLVLIGGGIWYIGTHL